MNNHKILQISLIVFVLGFVSCRNGEEKADAYGNFEAIQVTVSSLGNGRLLELNVEEGQLLLQDKVYGIVDTFDLHLKRQQAVSQHQAVLSRIATVDAQARVQQQQLTNLGVDRDRIRQLLTSGAATEKQRDDIEGAYRLAEYQMKATTTQIQSITAEAEVILRQVEQINEQIKNCYITSPMSGIVLTKFAESGEVVTFGKPLFKIANLNTLEIKAYISGNRLVDFKIGQEVQVIVDKSKNENKILTGTVSWIASTAEFTPKTIQTKDERVDLVYALKVKVKNDGSLKIGMPGEIRINY
jgi:HlyD family secretion protein